MKVIKQDFSHDTEPRAGTDRRRNERGEAVAAGGVGVAIKDEATLARELAARIQEMNEDRTPKKPSITVKKMQTPATANARMIFNPLHPSQELPPEQLIRLISMHGGGEPKRTKKPRHKAPAEPAPVPVEIAAAPIEPATPAPVRTTAASIRFEEPVVFAEKPSRARYFGLAAVLAILGVAAVPMFLGDRTMDGESAAIATDAAAPAATAVPSAPATSKVTSARKLPATAPKAPAPAVTGQPARNVAAAQQPVEAAPPPARAEKIPAEAAPPPPPAAVAPTLTQPAAVWDDNPTDDPAALTSTAPEPEAGTFVDEQTRDAFEIPLEDIDLASDPDAADAAPMEAATIDPPTGLGGAGTVYRENAADGDAAPAEAGTELPVDVQPVW